MRNRPTRARRREGRRGGPPPALVRVHIVVHGGGSDAHAALIVGRPSVENECKGRPDSESPGERHATTVFRGSLQQAGDCAAKRRAGRKDAAKLPTNQAVSP